MTMGTFNVEPPGKTEGAIKRCQNYLALAVNFKGWYDG